jgi:hypothetical protein
LNSDVLKSVECFKKSIEIDSNILISNYNLVLSFIILEDYKQAVNLWIDTRNFINFQNDDYFKKLIFDLDFDLYYSHVVDNNFISDHLLLFLDLEVYFFFKNIF